MKNKFYTVIIALFLSSNSLIAYAQLDEISPDFKLKNSFGEYVSFGRTVSPLPQETKILL